MDHLYCSSVIPSSDVSIDNNDEAEVDDIQITENLNDCYLIDLYRERRFLYDKSHKDFKDTLVKDNAWLEISKIMINKMCGDHYTPQYCKTKIRSLREKYNRFQKSNRYIKTGSAATVESKCPLLKQLSFLDSYIQRRRTFSNVTNIKETSDVLDNIENINISSQKKSDVTEIKKNKEQNIETKSMKRKCNEDEIFGVINNLTNILSADSSEEVEKSAESAFGSYIAMELQRYNEPERSIKKQKLMQVLFSTVDEI